MEATTTATRETRANQSKEVARIAAFSDGVFAFAVTLLVLQLEVPKSGDLAHELTALWPFFISFVISFFVIASYWVSHHRLFALIERYDGRLIWLNFLELFFIVLLPFTASLVGEHGDQPIAPSPSLRSPLLSSASPARAWVPTSWSAVVSAHRR